MYVYSFSPHIGWRNCRYWISIIIYMMQVTLLCLLFVRMCFVCFLLLLMLSLYLAFRLLSKHINKDKLNWITITLSLLKNKKNKQIRTLCLNTAPWKRIRKRIQIYNAYARILNLGTRQRTLWYRTGRFNIINAKARHYTRSKSVSTTSNP
jgi:hypothetical protein